MIYKCKNCGGELQFDPKTQKLHCPFCESIYELCDYEEDSAQPQKQAAPAPEADLHAFVCPHCAAKLVAPANTLAMNCIYCDTPMTLNRTQSSAIECEKIIPFQVDYKELANIYESYMKTRPFAPDAYAPSQVIESIKGIYIPFWLYRTQIHASMLAKGEQLITRETRDEIITTHHVYELDLQAQACFERVPVDALKSAPNDAMDSIEPFDFSKLKPYKPAYLAGYSAQSYDEDQKTCQRRLKYRIQNSMHALLMQPAAPYRGVSILSENIPFQNVQSECVLLPAYLLFMDYDAHPDNVLAINGQTGKIVGNIPVDKKKAWKYFLRHFVIFYIILSILAFGIFLFL